MPFKETCQPNLSGICPVWTRPFVSPWVLSFDGMTI
jgi:hypothetical protein